MGNQAYENDKARISYELMKVNKYFKKVRVIVLHNNKLLAIKVVYKDGRKDHYLFPGGGVDDGESLKSASIREAYEEYGVKVVPQKLLGKLYYSMSMNYCGEVFKSKRIDYYYICELGDMNQNTSFGIDGEFDREDRVYSKVELSLGDILELEHSALNDMNEKIYNKLVEYIKIIKF